MEILSTPKPATIEPGALPIHLAGGFNLQALPPDTLLDDAQAAAALSLKPATLAVWRTTGRYNLPYLKIGRLVRYRAGDLAAWLDKRARLHSGQ
jgi:hypothetical protein